MEYADACFKEFGDRVLHWTTLNEVNIAAIGGYDVGIAPPGRCSTRSRCAAGNSSTEPYKALHNMLLAHSAAAKLYREQYKVYFILLMCVLEINLISLSIKLIFLTLLVSRF